MGKIIKTFGVRHRVIILAVLFTVVNFAVFQNCAPASFKSMGSTSAGTLGGDAEVIELPPAPDTLPAVPPPSEISADIPNADINFGQVLLNTVSPIQSITIKNNTPDDDILLTLGTSGAAEYFTIDHTSCDKGVKPLGTCQIDFRFTSINIIPHDALVRIVAVKKSDVSKGKTVEFHLLGVGYNDLAATLSSNTLDFGNQVVINNSSPVKTITVTNKTPSDSISVVVKSPGPGNLFTVDASNCANVAANATCTINVVFNPRDTTAQNSTVTFEIRKRNDPFLQPITANVVLTGTGASDFLVEMPLAVVDFGKVRLNTTQTESIEITNRTPSSSVVVSVSLDNANFSVDPNSPCLKQALAYNSACTLVFSFSPLTTALKTVVGSVTIAKSSDLNTKVVKSVQISGSGFIIPASSLDQLFLVGWYFKKETANVSYLNRTADNVNCPALVLPPSADGADFQGQQREFCFEPSGGHGLQLAVTAADKDAAAVKLKNYILSSGGFQAVPTLDQLFSLPSDHTSMNLPLKEALFYYSLGYLNIPRAQFEDANFDVQFNVHYVDDAIGFVVNNQFAGYVPIIETLGSRRVVDAATNVDYFDQPGVDFPLSLKSGKDNRRSPTVDGVTYQVGSNNLMPQSPLKQGANTVMSMWLDDREVQRNIVGAQIKYKSSQTGGLYQPLKVCVPNVIQGYAFNSLTGAPLDQVSIKVLDSTTGELLQQVMSDATGFYRFEGVTDGNRTVQFSKAGFPMASEVRAVNHNSAATAILDVSKGL